MKRYIITFLVIFLLVATAGFIYAHISGKKDERLKDEAIQIAKIVNNVNSPYLGCVIYGFRDKAIVYNSSTKTFEDILSYQSNDHSTSAIAGISIPSEASAYITIFGATASLFKYAFKKAPKGGSKPAVIWAGVVVGGILGIVPGYWLHERFFPPCYSDEMWDFLHKKENWEYIYPKIIEKEKFSTTF
jgi:hypothetical protein